PHTALSRLQTLASPEEARALWQLAGLRRRAVAKFGQDSAVLYFDREALEMASPARVAAYHAQRFVSAGMKTVLDLGGGIGADSMAFARAGLGVTLYERDLARWILAVANTKALGLANNIEVVCGDITKAKLPMADAAFLDPARRSGARKWAGSVEETDPPLSFVREVMARGIGAIGAKLSPTIPREIADMYGGEIEFVSHAGECKEAFLALGALRQADAISAVVLREKGDGPAEERLTGNPGLRSPVGLPEGQYLYEPDPAVIRAHLVGPLAARLSTWQFDPQIAYLIGNELTRTAFASAYEIQASLPYNRKAVQEALRRHNIGRVVIKKRGFPEEPEAVRRQLRLSGEREGVLILARHGKRHWAFIAARVDLTG
ncbi:MAG TPA: methyltransferase, partial [Capsulimonadaceae bacterium]|nr:methyltransferase [Capsulimonadaceae bacterium]